MTSNEYDPEDPTAHWVELMEIGRDFTVYEDRIFGKLILDVTDLEGYATEVDAEAAQQLMGILQRFLLARSSTSTE